MIPGVMAVQPDITYYDSNSGDKPGYETRTSRSELASTYENYPVYGYNFELDGNKCFFAFSYDRKIINPFEASAWIKSPIVHIVKD